MKLLLSGGKYVEPPENWPETIEYDEVDGSSTLRSGKSIYDEYYQRGWNEAVREFDTGLEKSFRHLNGV